ncbi:MAG: DUF2249 domain-containing protein [Chthoniobacterales bacterium]
MRPIIARGAEPFTLIRSRVDTLKAREGLTIVAPFLPAPLIEKLRSEGFRSEVHHQPDGAWAVNVWADS